MKNRSLIQSIGDNEYRLIKSMRNGTVSEVCTLISVVCFFCLWLVKPFYPCESKTSENVESDNTERALSY